MLHLVVTVILPMSAYAVVSRLIGAELVALVNERTGL
jgi:hypothetical protein